MPMSWLWLLVLRSCKRYVKVNRFGRPWLLQLSFNLKRNHLRKGLFDLFIDLSHTPYMKQNILKNDVNSVDFGDYAYQKLNYFHEKNVCSNSYNISDTKNTEYMFKLIKSHSLWNIKKRFVRFIKTMFIDITVQV